MNIELMGALRELERERGIDRDILSEAIEAAILSAYKRHYGSVQNVSVEIDKNTGEIHVYARKVVVAEPKDESMEISLEDAKKLDRHAELDDVVEVEITPADFGRIAAQTAKQVVIQRIREAERDVVYEEFASREGDIVTGIVQRREGRNLLIDLGRVEAILPVSEQTKRETFNPGQRIKVYIAEVRKTTKGPQVILSRTHPGLLKRLFELEVPEIHEGIVEIRAVAREPGARSKIAVSSRDENVDPVGACVGPRGMRVQAVVRELRGEKIDIIAWHPDPGRFVANALSPAKVVGVYVSFDETAAWAVVPEDQLSLAIGKEGQNARLAARLTNMRIDVKSEQQWAEVKEEIIAQEQQRREEARARARMEARAAKKDAEDEPDVGLEVIEEEPLEEEREPKTVASPTSVAPVIERPRDEDRFADSADLSEEGGDEAEVSAEPAEDEAHAEGPPPEKTEDQADQDQAIEEPEESEEETADEKPPIEDLLLFSPEDLRKMQKERERRIEQEPARGAEKPERRREKSRHSLQQEVEEELIEEDEPLPSLFESTEEEGEVPRVFQVGSEDDQSGDEPASDKAAQKASRGKEKKKTKVLKDFSQLNPADFGFNLEDDDAS